MNKNSLSIAIQASIEAGKSIMNIYTQDFEIVTKADDSPLTLADTKANDIINLYLSETEFPIISEENKLVSYSIRKEWRTCWIVDPLDGTKEFIKRNGEFTVNIALVNLGKPVLGVIYVPVTKEIFFTSADMSMSLAYKIDNIDDYDINAILSDAKRMVPANLKDGEVTKIVGSRSHLNDETQNYVNAKKLESEVEMVSKGSSLKFCLIAQGKAHLYPRFAPTMEWDTAAGQAICEAAGVQVIDKNTNLPLKYNKENLLNPYFLVSK